jgi:hypothetical protein
MTRTWTQSTRHAELLNIHTQIGKAAVRRHLFNHKLTSARRQHLQPWALHIVHDEFNFTNLRRTCISAACPVWLPNSTLVECQTVVGKYKELNSKANSDIFLDRERYALKPVKAQACMLATTNALGNFDHITSCANIVMNHFLHFRSRDPRSWFRTGLALTSWLTFRRILTISFR